MALATQCPHCGTVFRVAADQLKLRGGMVRCGKCRQVFDGSAALVDISLLKAQQDAAAARTQPPAGAAPAPEAAVGAAPAPAAPSQPQAEPEYSLDFDLSLPPLPQTPATRGALAEPPQLIIDFDLDLTPPAQAEEAAAQAPQAAEAAPVAPAEAGEAGETEHTAETEAAEEAAAKAEEAVEAEEAEEAGEAEEAEEAAVAEEGAEAAHGVEAADALQSGWPAAAAFDEEAPPIEPEPANAAELVPSVVAGETFHTAQPLPQFIADEDIEEPGFVTRVRRKEKLSRVSRVLMAVGSVLLLAALAAQAAITFGSVLAARYPRLKPALVATCQLLQCRIALPERIDALAVETGELQTLGGDTFSFGTVLRNQGTLVQAWPHLELSLTDANDVTLVRRVIAPKEYLPPRTDIAKGFAPRSEQSIKVYFELSQVKASGYKIAIFYP